MSNSKQQTIVALVKHTDLFLTFTEHQNPFICCGPSPLFISWPNLAKNQYTLDLRVSYIVRFVLFAFCSVTHGNTIRILQDIELCFKEVLLIHFTESLIK